MGKSEGEVACTSCGGTEYIDESTLKPYKNMCCFNCGKQRQSTPIHPARLAAEGLVPAAALEELVKALENLLDCWQRRVTGFALPTELEFLREDAAKSALAHAREIAKGGK